MSSLIYSYMKKLFMLNQKINLCFLKQSSYDITSGPNILGFSGGEPIRLRIPNHIQLP